jgi:hypothetical protein
VLVTGNEKTPAYFKNKGFETILNYSEMVKPTLILPKGGN